MSKFLIISQLQVVVLAHLPKLYVEGALCIHCYLTQVFAIEISLALPMNLQQANSVVEMHTICIYVAIIGLERSRRGIPRGLWQQKEKSKSQCAKHQKYLVHCKGHKEKVNVKKYVNSFL